MAKIQIEIDGKNVSVKIDGKEVEGLKETDFSHYLYSDEYSDVYFSYSVENEKTGDFGSVTNFRYIPCSASFSAGEEKIITTAKAYERL